MFKEGQRGLQFCVVVIFFLSIFCGRSHKFKYMQAKQKIYFGQNDL